MLDFYWLLQNYLFKIENKICYLKNHSKLPLLLSYYTRKPYKVYQNIDQAIIVFCIYLFFIYCWHNVITCLKIRNTQYFMPKADKKCVDYATILYIMK